jgi:hypothetical protein
MTNSTLDLAALKTLAEAATPGPWRWAGSVRDPMLVTVYGGHVYVMGFERSGMRGAQPTFQVYGENKEPGSGVMHPASEMAVREVPYRDDIVGIDNPDAAYIAAMSPDVARALIERCEAAEAALSVERIAEALHRTGKFCALIWGGGRTPDFHTEQAAALLAALDAKPEPPAEVTK